MLASSPIHGFRTDLRSKIKPRSIAAHPTSRKAGAVHAAPQESANPLKRKIADNGATHSDSSAKHRKTDGNPAQNATIGDLATVMMQDDKLPTEDEDSNKPADGSTPQASASEDTVNRPVTDEDWIRSRTSRLLGLVDDDEDEEMALETGAAARDSPVAEKAANRASAAVADATIKADGPDDPPQSTESDQAGDSAEHDMPMVDATEEQSNSIRETGRLFLRNLSYQIKEEDLDTLFAPYGQIQEASAFVFVIPATRALRMNIQIGTTYVNDI